MLRISSFDLRCRGMNIDENFIEKAEDIGNMNIPMHSQNITAHITNIKVPRVTEKEKEIPFILY